METVLTAVVTRVLKRFIKKTSSSDSNDLRVRLNNGRVVLHNLELDLDHLFAASSGGSSPLSISVKRAFARELSVVIPWTGLALGTDAMEIDLDTVEIVLDIGAKHKEEEEEEEEEEHVSDVDVDQNQNQKESRASGGEGEKERRERGTSPASETDTTTSSRGGMREVLGKEQTQSQTQRQTSNSKGNIGEQQQQQQEEEEDEDDRDGDGDEEGLAFSRVSSTGYSNDSPTSARDAQKESEEVADQKASSSPSPSPSSSKGWLSSLLSTLGDTSVKIRNLVVRCHLEGETVATLMCGEIRLFTSFLDEFNPNFNPNQEAAGDVGDGNGEKNGGGGLGKMAGLDPSYFFSKWIAANTIMLHLSHKNVEMEPVFNINDMKAHIMQPSPLGFRNGHKSASASDLSGLHQQSLEMMDPSVTVHLDELTLNVSAQLADPIASLRDLLTRMKKDSNAAREERGGEKHENVKPALHPALEENHGVEGVAHKVSDSREEKQTSTALTRTQDSGNKKESSSWLSFGSSIAAKTWDFVIANEEGETDDYLNKSEEELKLERELEEQMSSLWSKFSFDASVNKLKVHLLFSEKKPELTRKMIAVSLDGISGGTWYESSTFGRAHAKISSLKVEHAQEAESILNRNHTRESILLCNGLDEPSEAEIDEGAAIAIRMDMGLEDGHSRSLSVCLGDTWFFYDGQTLEDLKELLEQMTAPVKNHARKDSELELEDEKEEGLPSSSQTLKLRLTLVRSTLCCDRNHPLLSQLGFLLEDFRCSMSREVSGEKLPCLDLELSSALYLVHLKKLSSQSYIRNYLTRAVVMQGHVKQDGVEMNAALDLEEFECCLEGKRLVDLVEGVFRHNKETLEEVLREFDGIYFHMDGFRFRMRKASDAMPCIAISGITLGLFLNPINSGGIRAMLVEVADTNLSVLECEKKINVGSVTGCFCRDDISCNTLLKSILASKDLQNNVILHSLETSLGSSTAVQVGQILSTLSYLDLQCLTQIASFAGKMLPPQVEPVEGRLSVKIDKSLIEICDRPEGGQSLSVAVSDTHFTNIISKEHEEPATEIRTHVSELSLASIAVNYTFQQEDSLVLYFHKSGEASGERSPDFCLTQVSKYASNTETIEKQSDIKVGKDFTCSLRLEMLSMVMELLTLMYKPESKIDVKKNASEAKVTKQNNTNSCMKLSLKAFELYFDGFHYNAEGERLFLVADALMLALFPSDAHKSGEKRSEIDICTLSFRLGVAKPSLHEVEEHTFLGPTDIHWKWESLESFVISIDAECLPLQLYWPIHRVIPSAFYGLFRVIYDGWQRMKEKAGGVEEAKEATQEEIHEKKRQPPFLIVVLQGSEMHLDIHSGGSPPSFLKGDFFTGSVVKLVSKMFKLGFHFWSSSNYLFTFLGNSEARYNNAGTFTEETFIPKFPVRASLGFNYEEGKGEKSLSPVARNLKGDMFAVPYLFDFENASDGVSLELFTESKIDVILSSGLLSRIKALPKDWVQPESVFIRNLSLVPLVLGQAGSSLTKSIDSGEGSHFAWPCPSILGSGKREVLRVKLSKFDYGWSNEIDIKGDGCKPVELPVSDTHQLLLVARVASKCGMTEVILRHQHCIINCTDKDLGITFAGSEGRVCGCEVLKDILDDTPFDLPKAFDDGHELSYRDIPVLVNRGDIRASQPKFQVGAVGSNGLSEPINILSNVNCPVISQSDKEMDLRIVESALFCEFLPHHADTGQTLIRLHPSIYLTNGLSETIHISSQKGVATNVPSNRTKPLSSVGLMDSTLSFEVKDGTTFSARFDRRSLSGWFQLDFKSSSEQRAIRSAVLVESVQNGVAAFLRIVPEISVQNWTGINMKVALGPIQKSSVSISPKEIVHDLDCSSERWQLNLLLEDAVGLDDKGGEKAGVVDLTELQYANPGSQSTVCSKYMSFQDSGSKFLVSSTRTTFQEGPHIFYVGVYPLFSVMNMCKKDLYLKCRRNDEVEILCERDQLTGLSHLDVESRDGEVFAFSTQLRWAKAGAQAQAQAQAHVACGLWSENLEISTEMPCFRMENVPEQVEMFTRNVPVSLYTFAYEGRHILLISEEAFPPFVFENESKTDFQVWLTNRKGTSFQDIEPEGVFDLRQGTIWKDFGMHFAHLCVSNAVKKRSEQIRETLTDDLLNAEVETVLSFVNKTLSESTITMYFKPSGGEGEWSKKVLNAEEQTEDGIGIASTYMAPSWFIRFFASPDGKGSCSETKTTPWGISLDLHELQIILVEPEELLNQVESNHCGCNCQLLLKNFEGRVTQWVHKYAVDETVYDVDVSWGALQFGIDQPSRAVLWTKCSEKELSSVKALLRAHESPLASSTEAESSSDGVLHLERAELSLSTVNLRIDDAVLLFFLEFQKRFFSTSDLLPLGRFTLNDQGGETLQETIVKNIKGVCQVSERRMYIGKFVINTLGVICTFRSSGRIPIFPYTLDVLNSPIGLQMMSLENVHTNQKVLMHTLSAYYIAEGIANAPQIVGSLGLLFNPIGIVESVKNGVQDLIGTPLEGLKAGEPLTFVGGIGLGSLKFIGHVSGSLLSSVSSFSTASARILQNLYHEDDGASASYSTHEQKTIAQGMVYGVSGLYNNVRSGLVGAVQHPVSGYQRGQMLAGIGRGLLGVVASPIGGALQLIGDVTQGVLDTTGFTDVPLAQALPSCLFVCGSLYRFQQLSLEKNETYHSHFLLTSVKLVQEETTRRADTRTGTLMDNAVLLLTDASLHLVRSDCHSFVSSVSVKNVKEVVAQDNSVQITFHCAQAFVETHQQPSDKPEKKHLNMIALVCKFDLYNMQSFQHLFHKQCNINES